MTISSSCSFPGTTNGVDAGTGTTNSAAITVSTGATLTISASQTVATGTLNPSGGSIAVVTGGAIKIGTPLWAYDADADGYPKDTTMAAQLAQEAGFRRRNLMTSMTTRDCRDFYGTGITCDPATMNMTDGTYYGAYQEASGNPAGSYRELPADRATVGLWHMNEASGTSVADASGNANTGTATGTTVVTGKLGNARSFNGSVPDFITVTGNAGLKPQSVTVEAWVKFTTTDTSGGEVLSMGDSYTLRVYTTNQARFSIYNGTNWNEIVDSDVSSLADGNWHHVAAIKDAATNKVWVYVDGVGKSATSTSAISYNLGTNFFIGKHGNGGTAFDFTGQIDEVRISNVARTPEEIKANAQRKPYASYIGPTQDLTQTPGSWSSLNFTGKGNRTSDGETPASSTSLTAQWNFNETSGTTAASGGSCGASCNGTLTNFASTASQDQAAGTGWTANNKRWGAGALMFDGSNDYVNLTTPITALETSEITIESWVKFNTSAATSGIDTIYSYQPKGSQTDGRGISLFRNTSNYLVLRKGDSTAWIDATSAQTLTNGQWYHLTGAFDTASGLRIYINGVLSGNNASTTAITWADGAGTSPNAKKAMIGAIPQSTSQGDYMDGTIDSTRIYSRALTASEILANYQAGNIEFQTRTSADNSTWEAWKPTTSETAIDSMDGPYQYNTTDTGLVAYWPMDETADNSCTGGEDACDRKGTNHGTATGTVIVDGKFGKSRDFNGSSDYVSISASSNFNMGTGDFSLEAWVRSDTLSGGDIIIGLNSGDYLTTEGAQLRMMIDSIQIAAGGTLVTNQWHHIAATRSGASVTLYVDGTSAATGSSSASVGDGTSAVWLGDYSGALNRWDGEIDEVRVYKGSALSAATIQQHFTEGVEALGVGSGRLAVSTDTTTKIEGTASEKLTLGAPQVDANTVGLWHLEETSGTGAYIKDATLGSSVTGFNPDTGSSLTTSWRGYWDFDESSGNAADSSGAGNTLTTTGGVTYQSSGKKGTAVTLDGSSGYFTCTDANCGGTSKLGFGSEQSFSVGAWVYPNTGEEFGWILAKADDSANAGYQLYLNSGPNNATFYVYDPDQVSCAASAPANTVLDDQWSLVIGTFNAATDTIKIYVNGQEQGSLTDTTKCGGVNPTITNADFRIGARSVSNHYHVNGRIDEAFAYAKVLSTTEITDLYNSGSGNTYGPYIRYNHGTPTGTTVVDGFYGKARSFNGTSDYISVADSASLRVSETSGITLEAWVKLDQIGGAYTIFSKKINTSTWSSFNFYVSAANQLVFQVQNETLNQWPQWVYLMNPQTGRWYHVAATFKKNAINSTDGAIYVDGQSVPTTFTANGYASNFTIEYSTQAMTLGQLNGIYYWNGSIDEAKISNAARSAEEIAEAYRAGRDHRLTKSFGSAQDLSAKNKVPFYVAADRPGTFLEATVGESAYANYEPDANTVGLWHLEEKDGPANTYFKDSSGTGNNSSTITGTTPIQGKLGKARDFDGTDDKFVVTDNSSLDLTSALTISLWATTDAIGGGNRFILDKSDYPTVLDEGYGLFYNTSSQITGWQSNAAGYCQTSGTTTLVTGTWYYFTFTYDGATSKIYVNGNLETSASCARNPTQNAINLRIGARSDDGQFHNGFIDEVRIDNTARTADEIRQAYEVGKRTHPVTIDFSAKGDAGNLIANSTDYSFTVDATAFGAQNKGDNVFAGDKIIVRENVGGTEYIAQGDVSAVTASTGAVTVSAWDAGATFPTGGYTANSHFFKWQREYFDITGSMGGHRDGSTRLTIRVLNGHEGRTVWLDDFRSASYLADNTPDSFDTATGIGTYSVAGASIGSTLQRYIQTRAIFSSWDPAVSATLTSSSVEYGL